MKTRKICKHQGCGARAWQHDLCNLHALERYRSGPRPRGRNRSTAERLAEGKRLLRARARELGIVLADDPETKRVEVRAAASAGRARSPVA